MSPALNIYSTINHVFIFGAEFLVRKEIYLEDTYKED
jgi:hypothetical protein